MSLSTPATLSSRQGLVVASDLSESLISLKGISPSILASGSDPIKEISRILRDDPVKQLNIVAHGAPGSIGLGTGLNKETLIANQQQLAEWNVERIALWSCEVAQDKDFIALLEEFTGADVVASKKKLGLGNTLANADNDVLKVAVENLPFSLHTNSVGFDINPGDQAGVFDVSIFYGTYHGNGEKSHEGALSLFGLDPNGDSQNFNHYNTELYGRGGDLSVTTPGFAFQNAPNGQFRPDSSITLNREDSSSQYLSDQDIAATGFVPGQTYFYTQGGSSPLVGSWNSSIQEHQVAYICHKISSR